MGAAKRKKNTAKPPGKEPVAPAEKVSKSTVISVDFSGHEEVLEGIRKQAAAEIRPVGDQILWVCKTALQH
jgi:hypothetical protein